MARRNEARKSKLFTVRLTQELADEFERQRKDGESVSACCRRLVVGALNDELRSTNHVVTDANSPALSFRVTTRDAERVGRLVPELGRTPTAACQRLLVAAIGRGYALRWERKLAHERVEAALDRVRPRTRGTFDEKLSAFVAEHTARGESFKQMAAVLDVSVADVRRAWEQVAMDFPPLRLGPD